MRYNKSMKKQNNINVAIFDVSSHLHKLFHSPRNKDNQNNLLNPFIDLFNKEMRGMGNPSHVIFVFDGRSNENFRNKIYSEYKANRPPPDENYVAQKRMIFSFLKQSGATVLCNPKYEADDLIATISRKLSKAKIKHTIATKDKDLFCLVNEYGKLFLGVKLGIYGVSEVHKDKGVFPHQMNEYLTLVGDVSDNIIGVRGVGAKTAAKILEKFDLSDVLREPENLLQIDNIRGVQKIIDYIDHNEDDIWFMKSIIDLEDNVKLDFNLSDSRVDKINFQAQLQNRNGNNNIKSKRRVGMNQ